MIWIPFLLAVPGAISGTLALSRISPWAFNNRVTPLMMILFALLMMFLPIRIEIAFAVAPIAALIANRTGFDFTGHDAADWSWAWTVPKTAVASTVERFKRVVPIQVTEFVKPGQYAHPDEIPVAPVAPVASTPTSVPKYVPDL
jgi:hypothetical protein